MPNSRSMPAAYAVCSSRKLIRWKPRTVFFEILAPFVEDNLGDGRVGECLGDKGYAENFLQGVSELAMQH